MPSSSISRAQVLAEHPGAESVVDVVVDVGDPIDHPHDPPLERRRRLGPGVAQDPVAHLRRQVQALDPLDHT